MILRLINKKRKYLPASTVSDTFVSVESARKAALKILKSRSDISRVELWETDSITDPDKKVASWGQRDVDKEPLGINSLLKDLKLTQAKFADLIGSTSTTITTCKSEQVCPKWFPAMMTLIRHTIDTQGADKALELLQEAQSLRD